jgi:hypothetical protein
VVGVEEEGSEEEDGGDQVEAHCVLLFWYVLLLRPRSLGPRDVGLVLETRFSPSYVAVREIKRRGNILGGSGIFLGDVKAL